MLHKLSIRACNRMRFSLNFGIVFLALVTLGWSANSITHYGITWNFSVDRTVGTFANGEPWVVGPVIISNIIPNPGQSEYGKQNGSMVNPVANRNHGFDSNPITYGDGVQLLYQDSLNAALSLPLALQPGDVLVSVKSRTIYDYFIKTVCALTVLDSPAPIGSFRPGIFGPDREKRLRLARTRNVNQFNWSALKNYTAVPATPGRAAILAQMPALPWFEWSASWTGYRLQAGDNTADGNKQYGRETAAKFGQVGLWLNTNQPMEDKRAIAIQMVQNGIDIDAYVRSGGGFWPDGGHKHGRKLPVVIAAMMLDDAELRATASNQNKNLFQEDGQTWYVTQADVGRELAAPSPGYSMLQYRQEDVGIAEWGIRHSWMPSEDNRDWNTGYRGVVGPSMMGCWLAAYLMGGQSTWAHAAAFGYMERYNSIAGGGDDFTAQMYNTHKAGGIILPPPSAAASPLIVPASGIFESPQLVTISSTTPSATLRYTLDGTTPDTSDSAYIDPIVINSTTTIKAVAYATGMNPSGISTGQLNFSAAPPIFSPLPSGFSTGQVVTLRSQSLGASIRYTTDGSDPDLNSQLYISPISVISTTTIKAVAIKEGFDTSPVATGLYAIGGFVGSQTWIFSEFIPQTATFVYGFEMMASAGNIDAVVGLGGISPVTGYDQLACIIRFNTNGRIDARNGGAYSAVADLPYIAGKIYVVRMTVNPATKTYGATVSVEGGDPLVIAENYAFRSDQATLATFNTLALYAYVGSPIISSNGLMSPQIVPSQPQGLRVIDQ